MPMPSSTRTAACCSGLYVERPTNLERVESGELIGLIIIIVGALGFLAFVFQLIHLVIVRLGGERAS